MKFVRASLILATVCIAAFANSSVALSDDYGELAGNYSGKNKQGGEVILTIPNSGIPSYTFNGARQKVAGAKTAGKNIDLVVPVDGGDARITISPAGKNKLSWNFRFKNIKDTTILVKKQ
ncbi:hypothetical protein [Rhizobium sp. ZW T2_16]|uniref:hypothetical protein n=1 Tax=Rhizobium sp. ZW T2_16 TaxID=3378083 RepID=UPI003852041A